MAESIKKLIRDAPANRAKAAADAAAAEGKRAAAAAEAADAAADRNRAADAAAKVPLNLSYKSLFL